MAKTSHNQLRCLGLVKRIIKIGNSSGKEDRFPTMVLTITNLREKLYAKFVKNVFKNLSQCPAITENLYKT